MLEMNRYNSVQRSRTRWTSRQHLVVGHSVDLRSQQYNVISNGPLEQSHVPMSLSADPHTPIRSSSAPKMLPLRSSGSNAAARMYTFTLTT